MHREEFVFLFLLGQTSREGNNGSALGRTSSPPCLATLHTRVTMAPRGERFLAPAPAIARCPARSFVLGVGRRGGFVEGFVHAGQDEGPASGDHGAWTHPLVEPGRDRN